MHIQKKGKVVAWLLRESDSKSKGCEFESQTGRYCRWREWMSSALSTFNTTTRCPWARHRTAQLLPGLRSIIMAGPLLWVCVHGCVVCTAVCVHFGWVLLIKLKFIFCNSDFIPHKSEGFFRQIWHKILHSDTFFHKSEFAILIFFFLAILNLYLAILTFSWNSKKKKKKWRLID